MRPRSVVGSVNVSLPLRLVIVTAVATGVACLAGCTAMMIGDGAGSATREGTNGSAAISDAEITEAVRWRLLADASLEATRIDVTTNRGRVTLSGRVTSFAERERAARLTAMVAGVSSVDNRLAVTTGQ